MGGTSPSNASIDALFRGAKSARVVAGPGFPGGVLLEVAAGDLGALRETLRIVESDERFHCMCRGDLAIELRGRFLSAGQLSFHHALSLRLADWCSDARLVDGPALLRFLAERGVAEPMQGQVAALAEGRARASARDEWVAAAPAVLREGLPELENGPLGMPRSLQPAELDAVRARLGDDDRALARALLAWLAVGRGPWSGYASYESLPIRLLERLPIAAVIEVASDPALDDASVAAAARFFGDHELVSFRKSALAAVPDAFFARARSLLEVEDDRVRHEHAARTAMGARKARGAPYALGDGLEVLGESTDGPLSGLAAVGDALISTDVRTVVRFDPGSVAAVPIADARDAYLTLSSTAPIAWAAGRLGEIATERGAVAVGENSPVEIASSDRGLAWIVRDGNRRAVRALCDGEVRTLATADLLWCLAIDGDRALFVDAGWRAGGTLSAVPLAGGDVVRIARLPELGASMASPRYAVEGSEVLIAVGEHVLAIDARGDARRIISTRKAGARIHAIAADQTHVALLVGEDSERNPPWSIAVAPRAGGRATTLATFARAPYHRHPLVLARGRACIVAGDRILAASLG